MAHYTDDTDAMQRAYAVAQWHLGDATWADTILRAYFDPENDEAAEALAELAGEPITGGT